MLTRLIVLTSIALSLAEPAAGQDATPQGPADPCTPMRPIHVYSSDFVMISCYCDIETANCGARYCAGSSQGCVFAWRCCRTYQAWLPDDKRAPAYAFQGSVGTFSNRAIFLTADFAQALSCNRATSRPSFGWAFLKVGGFTVLVIQWKRDEPTSIPTSHNQNILS